MVALGRLLTLFAALHPVLGVYKSCWTLGKNKRLIQSEQHERRLLADDACDDLSGMPDDFVSTASGAQNDGGYFCGSLMRNGAFINKITFRAGYNMMRSLEVQFNDDADETGTVVTWGNPKKGEDGRSATVTLDPDVDHITKMQMWSGGWNAHSNNGICRVVIEVSNGQKLDVACNWWNLHEEYGPTEVDVGDDGVLFGFEGRHGGTEGGIDQLTAWFSRQDINDKTVEDIVYNPTLEELNEPTNPQDRGFTATNMDKMVYTNALSTQHQVRFQATQGVETSHTYTIADSDSYQCEWGATWSLKIALVKDIFEWTPDAHYSGTWGSVNDTINEDTSSASHDINFWEMPYVLPATTVSCDAAFFQGRLSNIYWEGQAALHFATGSDGEEHDYRYSIHGNYANVVSSEMHGRCDNITQDEAQNLLIKGDAYEAKYHQGENLAY